MTKTGIERIAAERRRQVEREGWSPDHDDDHEDGELARAAACYASEDPLFVYEEQYVQANSSRGISDAYSYPTVAKLDYWSAWPWDSEYDKRKKHGRLRCLEIAGALIAAEIDRLLRIENGEVEG